LLSSSALCSSALFFKEFKEPSLELNILSHTVHAFDLTLIAVETLLLLLLLKLLLLLLLLLIMILLLVLLLLLSWCHDSDVDDAAKKSIMMKLLNCLNSLQVYVASSQATTASVKLNPKPRTLAG
jgi:hypothetical protein